MLERTSWILLVVVLVVFIFEIAFIFPKEFRGGVINRFDQILEDNQYYKEMILKYTTEIELLKKEILFLDQYGVLFPFERTIKNNQKVKLR